VVESFTYVLQEIQEFLSMIILSFQKVFGGVGIKKDASKLSADAEDIGVDQDTNCPMNFLVLI
jgi:hypothetical protein